MGIDDTSPERMDLSSYAWTLIALKKLEVDEVVPNTLTVSL